MVVRDFALTINLVATGVAEQMSQQIRLAIQVMPLCKPRFGQTGDGRRFACATAIRCIAIHGGRYQRSSDDDADRGAIWVEPG